MSRLIVAKPGHGQELYNPPQRTYGGPIRRFDNALGHSGLDDGWGMIKMITLRELTMLRFQNAVTDKPAWSEKVFDDQIIAKWKAETVKDNDDITEGGERVPFAAEMTKAMFDYSIQELRYRSRQHTTSPHGAIYVLPGDVYKSDIAISGELKLALQRAVRPLEDVPEDTKDWHPGSNDRVLDLVHPGLFPLIYGTSRILPIGSQATSLEDYAKLIGEGDVLPNPEGQVHVPNFCSRKFQWLPCDVDISGEKPRILTYINNLHPKHHFELYAIIEEIIAAAIPLWERTLALVNRDSLYDSPRRIEYTEADYHDESDDEDSDDYPNYIDGEPDDVYSKRVEEYETKRYESRRCVLPEPPSEFDPDLFEGGSFTMKDKVGERPLQIIVKLANIELSPEKPEYEGGSWHVEGMMNESICATAIYYYSSENVTESRLAFRQQSYNFDYDDVSYAQDHHHWLHQVFGLRQHGSTIQDLGSVVTKEGRLITFPNILQHRVQPFKLEDPSKPGHRKILALFLVDPHFSIISTADVPPQQHDWWAEETFGVAYNGPESTSKTKELLANLPMELRDKIYEDLKDYFPLTSQQAREYRQELMKERMNFQLAHQKSFESVEISLCEH